MNIQQVKDDYENGIMLSRMTVGKVIAAAELMNKALWVLHHGETPDEVRDVVSRALVEVGNL